VLNHLEAHNPVKSHIAGKLAKVAVDRNSELGKKVAPKWLDSDDVSALFDERRNHCAAASAVIENTHAGYATSG
jgi:hypothetical protein